MILKGNLESKTDSKYLKTLQRQTKKRAKQEIGTIIYDLRKIKLADALNIVLSNKSKNNIARARVAGTPVWRALTPFNIKRLTDYQALKGDQFKEEPGSDNQFIFQLDASPLMEVEFRKRTSNTKAAGAFFPYYSSRS